jgi:hypothetical protein
VGSSRAHDGDAAGPGDLARASEPVRLEDVDRLLRDSADLALAPTDDPASIRARRGDLTVVLAVLGYAREILSGDIALLHHCLTTMETAPRAAAVPVDLVRDLPRLLADPPDPDPATGPAPLARSPGDDELAQVVARADLLVSAHRHMAGTDLASPAAVGRTLGLLEAQLTTVAERQGAVTARLQEIRALVVRHYAARAGRGGTSLETPA